MNRSSDQKQILLEFKDKFKPDAIWIIVYCISIPFLILVGLVGNILCIRVVLKKFSKEIGFIYQALIMIVDSTALVLIFLYVLGFMWCLGKPVLGSEVAKHTAYWLEQSYILRYILQFIIRPLCHVAISMSPFLLIGVGIDRVVAIAKPLYYKNSMNRKAVFILVALTSLMMSIPVGVNSGPPFVTIEQVFINTSSHGVIPVYKRVSTSIRRSIFGLILAILTSFSKLASLGGVIAVSTAVVVLYRQQAKQHQQVAATKSSRAGARNEGGAPVDSKLLSKMMLIQGALVSGSSIPYVVLHIGSFFCQGAGEVCWSFITTMIPIVDLGYTLQASLNMMMYAAVSKRFRTALKSVFWAENAVAPQGAANPTADPLAHFSPRANTPSLPNIE